MGGEVGEGEEVPEGADGEEDNKVLVGGEILVGTTDDRKPGRIGKDSVIVGAGGVARNVVSVITGGGPV